MATYENPYFGFIHRLREIGGSAITANHGISGTEKGYLFDSRRELFTFDDEQSTHWLRFDYGATPDTTNRLFIPVGHNLSANSITLKAADSADMLTNPTTLGTWFLSPAAIDKGFPDNSQRYGELSITGTGTWSFPEIWITYRHSLDRGPEWPWVDRPQYNVLDFPKPSGDIATLEQGPQQRVFEMSWAKIKLAADLAIFDDLLDNYGRALPFLFWPPYGETPPLIVKLTDDPEREPGASNPGQEETRNIELQMIELIA
jgi:hypothetical protein